MENKIKHLGIIMDGNRRWAKKNKLSSVLMGHEKGAKKLLEVCNWCIESDIHFLSVYAFSTENWNRSKDEINGLFQLMDKFFQQALDKCIEQGIKIKIVGNKSYFNEATIDMINKVEHATSLCSMLQLNIAFSYGGRDEILRAIRRLSDDVLLNNVKTDDISEDMFSKYLDTTESPDFDMVIRTGGYQRLSNFFPWQTVYAELYFVETLWPDFNKQIFDEAISYYKKIQINNGK